MTYDVAEVFYSLQGEGCRAGSANVFLRFAGCNLNCTVASAGFDCDTDHAARLKLTAAQLVEAVVDADIGRSRWVVVTGGEPLLQLDDDLAKRLVGAGFRIAIETNGTVALRGSMAKGKGLIQHVACSPKPGKELRLQWATEVKVVLGDGDPIPPPPMAADHYYLSPATCGSEVNNDALAWCIAQCMADPTWRLSLQQHKVWRVR